MFQIVPLIATTDEGLAEFGKRAGIIGIPGKVGCLPGVIHQIKKLRLPFSACNGILDQLVLPVLYRALTVRIGKIEQIAMLFLFRLHAFDKGLTFNACRDGRACQVAERRKDI